jgi:hypothetical protein
MSDDTANIIRDLRVIAESSLAGEECISARAANEIEHLRGLVESAAAWLDQEIARAADQQRQSYAMSGEHGQRQGERWHARQIALYEAKLKFTSKNRDEGLPTHEDVRGILANSSTVCADVTQFPNDRQEST